MSTVRSQGNWVDSVFYPTWDGKMSTGGGYDYRCKFCITVGSVARTAGIPMQSVKGAVC